MFGVGSMEVLLIFVIGLLILGPERLPRVAAQLGRWVAKARRTANQLRYQLEREVALDEIYRAQKKKPQKRPGATAPGAQAADASAAGATAPETVASAEESAASASAHESGGQASAKESAPEAAIEAREASAAPPADSSHDLPSPTPSDRLEVAIEEAAENNGDDGPFRQSESSR